MHSHRMLRLLTALLLFCTALPVFAAEAPKAASPSAAARPVGPVNVMTAEALISAPGNYFDLQAKTLRFTPASGGGYSVKVLPIEWVELTTPNIATKATDFWWRQGWPIDLPFTFPFGGEKWTKLYVNNLGNLTFGAREADLWKVRGVWPDGTMRSVAASIDGRATLGLERMIAALWNFYWEDRPGKIQVQADSKGLVVTWRMERQGGKIGFEESPKPNLFQAHLYPDGQIDLSYKEIAERDGIVGLFPGVAGANVPALDSVTDPTDAPDPAVEVKAVDLYDYGSTLAFTLTMAGTVPKSVTTGQLMHRIILLRDGKECTFYTSIESTTSARSDCGFTPGLQIDSSRVSLSIPRSALTEAKSVTWKADVVWWTFDGRFDQVAFDRPRPISVKPVTTDLSAMTGKASGNIYETFHYPVFSKQVNEALTAVYKRFPADVDLAVMLTDFRYDSLFASSSGTGRMGEPVHGIGELYTTPRPAAAVGSAKVQSAFVPVYVGSPFLAESFTDGGYSTHDYGRGLDWIAHELTHSWTAGLSFRNPVTGKNEPLFNSENHWRPELHLPAVYPVVATYSNKSYADYSLMSTADGTFWEDNKDGTFTRKPKPYHFPSGLSALDLYAMGLIGPTEVPDTFMLTNIDQISGDRVKATKVPVRIADIIAATGPRQPDVKQSQKSFKLGIYLLTEPGRQPDPAMLKRTEELSAAVAKHLGLVTGGKMKITQ